MKTLIEYIGIPYAPRGIMPAEADCWTLVKTYAELVLGQRWPDYMYDVETFLQDASRHIVREMKSLGPVWQQVDSPDHGDLMLFRFHGHITHCGIYIGEGQMLHTMKGRSSCVEPIDLWRDRLAGTFRWVGRS